MTLVAYDEGQARQSEASSQLDEPPKKDNKLSKRMNFYTKADNL